ncbi:sodium-dependent serotonin transporter-like, partial [Ruditapes philippinarum]|uniref:sodium-dependent serotonin transporter-like n=1 Tax=Ruditapes philippinarum TaxID=129788 RepID=UPI00295B4719
SGAFLIPYFIMLVFLGLPLFYMELALGQFHRSGAILIWKQLCPVFTGVGFAICLVATYVGMYYNTIIAWALYYLIASFRSEVPWASCDNEWNTPHCYSITHENNQSFIDNQTHPSAFEYFYFSVLEAQKSNGIEDIGGIKWQLCLCLMGVMMTIYFALWKGIKSSGKAVWVTATVPYVVLLVLLVRGVTLPGADVGIKYYVTPVWSKLLDSGVWLDAAAQIFFSLGPGFGTLLALSSYNKFNNNCYMDAMLTAVINCLTSLLAGFVVFSVLGYMSYRLSIPIEDLAVEGPGLVFYVYPEAIATLDGSVVWSIIFFVLLITLGLDSSFGGLESVITAVCDMSPKLASRRELVTLCVVIYCFLGGLPTTTYGGQYIITLMDTHAAPVALIAICFIEAISVNWFYGVQRFSNDIEEMLGFQPGLYWKICWAVLCPLFLFVLFILSIFAYAGLSLDAYVFPAWSEVVGWLITVSSLLCIPAYMIYSLIVTPGNIQQKLVRMFRPSGTLQMPDYYRTVNGNGVVHVNSSELVPFHPDYKGVNINMTNYNAFIKDDNTVTQDNENTNLNEKETVEENCPNGGFNTYGTKDILENGNITTVQDT